MPQSRSSYDGDDLDDIQAWMARRNAQVALRPEADAAGRDLWNRAIQTGDDLYAGHPSDLTAIGLTALRGAAPHLTPPANDDRRYNGYRGGRGLGFERYGQPGRSWARIPQIWKDYYTGTAVGEALGLLPGEPSETPQ